MKKTIYLSLILILFVMSSAAAQFNAGRVFVGCNTNFQFTKDFANDNSFLNIGANGGLIIKDGMLVGGRALYQANGVFRSVELGGLVRYYWQNSVLPDGFFGDTSLNYSVVSLVGEGDSASSDFISWGVGVGYDWFVHKNIAIEPLLEYTTGLLGGGGSSLSFRAGIILAF